MVTSVSDRALCTAPADLSPADPTRAESISLSRRRASKSLGFACTIMLQADARQLSTGPDNARAGNAHMPSVELTFGRAFKVWWSYSWRVSVLMIPVTFAAALLAAAVVRGPPRPEHNASSVGAASGVWLIITIGSVLAQAQAMRWMLKTRWSDFRLDTTND
jgi:hypothetical protein